MNFPWPLNLNGGDSATTIVKGLVIHSNVEIISGVNTLALEARWGKEDRTEAIAAKNDFFLPKENPIEDKNGVKMEIFPCPCNGVTYNILKYISCEGRLSFVYVYQFRLLYELIF